MLICMICMPKINFITCFFHKTLLRNSKIVILDKLGMKQKNQLHPPCFSGDIAKRCKFSYFGYLGHVWLCRPKMIVSTRRKLRSLSGCQKYPSSFPSSLRYYSLLTKSILIHNSRTRILPDMELMVKYQ